MFHAKGPTLLELTVQALSSTRRGYDLLAPKFDYTPFRTPDSLVRAVAESLADLELDSALDLCCGTGAGMEMLRPLCATRVVGLDFSRGMLCVASERVAAAAGGAPVDLVQGDALALPFGAVFDAVICLGALGHILAQDERRFLSEVARVLRPGGRFVFFSSYMPPPWSLRYWLGRGFNTVMHARNALLSPPFVMYYLTFLLPDVRSMLEDAGLEVHVSRPQGLGRWAEHVHLVNAIRPPLPD